MIITVFSASFYCNHNHNKGAFVSFDNKLNPSIQQYYSSALNDTEVTCIFKNIIVFKETASQRLRQEILDKLKEFIVCHKPDLYNHFLQFDKNNTGFISKFELSYCLYLVTGLDISFMTYISSLAKIEANNKINYHDFLDRYLLDAKGISKEWYNSILIKICEKLLLSCSSLTTAFQKFDKNNDGVIDYDEFAGVIKTLNIDISRNQIYELMRYLDEKRENKIYYRQFASKVKVTFSTLKNAASKDQWLKISLSKIGQTLFSMNMPMNEIFDKFDKDKSKYLNEEEFSEAVEVLILMFFYRV